jgi:hypothetical protein
MMEYCWKDAALDMPLREEDRIYDHFPESDDDNMVNNEPRSQEKRTNSCIWPPINQNQEGQNRNNIPGEPS